MNRFASRPLLRTAAVVTAFALLAGCSMARFLYDQADWLVLREMDSYLDLREEQREHAAGLLAVSLSRHRSEQLPQVASVLQDAADRVRRGITDADAAWAYEQGREDSVIERTEKEGATYFVIRDYEALREMGGWSSWQAWRYWPWYTRPRERPKDDEEPWNVRPAPKVPRPPIKGAYQKGDQKYQSQSRRSGSDKFTEDLTNAPHSHIPSLTPRIRACSESLTP